ncbi:dihydroneopterin aldolase [Legionella shakespearei]|uniref:7,8-dihydroneopterin aldolase n=1 Tax=Legionella shakespearei DSM 23087 TaxID=1122169 RepID=A0A0W0ZBK6_9GAMM|nr:dihydroneopterin aldolase [Legionella shakespearei]KTD66399.1 dihydroneopterin aldolase FolB [Legionella shakespearei DSM 23087]
MDVLNITALSVATKIGVHAWEQKINQQLVIDISIPSNFADCDDKLENTIDYDALCHTITESVESQSFHLIESVAQHVAELVKREFGVARITVAVSKPHAIKNAGNIQVVVTR